MSSVRTRGSKRTPGRGKVGDNATGTDLREVGVGTSEVGPEGACRPRVVLLKEVGASRDADDLELVSLAGTLIFQNGFSHQR